ncbi:MAG TPA: glucan biosynthesis protein [Pontiellaceae bacterium]|nr:glucan biosynthesis protein [Pontiellaceae bacterium]
MNKYSLAPVVLLCAAFNGIAQDAGSRFDFNALKNRAQNLAAAPYQAPDRSLPEELSRFNYDDMRNIRFDPKAAIWRMERLPFQMQFTHRGGLQNSHITMNYIEDGQVEPIPFSKNLFNYSQVKINGKLPEDLGFYGFRIHYPLNSMEYLDEVISFQGASYFRALGKGLHYGLSARGLALNVAGQTPEEFPDFIEYWIEKPDTRATRIKIFALLNSPSLAGAYEMTLIPGSDTVMEIKTALFARKPVEGLGLAPLTSMFWFGEHSTSRHGDFRPEVHDSDGLLVHTAADEWLWRPLSNEGLVKTSCFANDNPRGFGLFQRDRDFSHYEDLETFYHNRPSAWVEPGPGWGQGELRLVELPSGTEYADNIVAFWMPQEQLTPEHPLEYSYRLHWFRDDATLPPLAQALATRIGNATEYPGSKKFVLDFSNAPGLDRNNPDSVTPVITLSNGTLKGKHLQRNDLGNAWRVFFDVEPIDRTKPVDMRCFLQSGGLPRSETWTYFWNP